MADPLKTQLRKLGQAVAAERRNRRITQERMAELCEVDRTYISRVERGATNVSFRNLWRIAAVLRLRIADLCDRAGV